MACLQTKERVLAPRSTFRNIADRLRAQIRQEFLKPGTMAPSELSLAAEYGVARGTVRSALELLVDEGLLEVVPGQGRRVIDRDGPPTPVTAYERIAADLARRIRGGEFRPNDSLPSESALVSRYGVSRSTVRRAYRVLIDEGLVDVRHGVGAFVITS